MALLHLDWCLMFWALVFDLSISLSFSILSIASFFFGSIVSLFNFNWLVFLLFLRVFKQCCSIAKH